MHYPVVNQLLDGEALRKQLKETDRRVKDNLSEFYQTTPSIAVQKHAESIRNQFHNCHALCLDILKAPLVYYYSDETTSLSQAPPIIHNIRYAIIAGIAANYTHNYHLKINLVRSDQ